jgi:hypothetical protein
MHNECCGNVWLTPDEGPSLETSKFSLYFSGSCIPSNKRLLLLTLYLHWHRQFNITVWYMFAEVNWEIAPYSCFTWKLQYITLSRIKSNKAQRYINITQRNNPKNIDLIMVIYIICINSWNSTNDMTIILYALWHGGCMVACLQYFTS